MYGEGNQETPWKDSISRLSCISRIFRPECSFDRQEAMNPCIQASDFPPPRLPGAQGRGNGFCRFSKKYDNKTKTRIPSLAAWARIPGRRGSTDSIVIKFHSWILVQCKESVDANSGLFKETDDAALDKNPYEIWFCEWSSASQVQGGCRTFLYAQRWRLISGEALIHSQSLLL